jgi:DivIVA domain-containing protein
MELPTDREPLSREDILNRSFSPCGDNGYDKAEVDAFLLQLVEEIDESFYERIGAEVATILQTAEDAATKLRLEAEGQASAALEDAAQKAELLMGEAERYVRDQQDVTERRCVELLREAAATLRMSREKAERLVTDAEGYALGLTESVERQQKMLERHKDALVERMSIAARAARALQMEFSEENSLGDDGARELPSAPERLGVVIDLRNNEGENMESVEDAIGRGSRE